MNISYNGQALTLSQPQSLLEVIEAQGAKAPFAVALNGQFVPRSTLAEQRLQEGDSIELLSPIQGG
ncbi:MULTISPECIES: sulfur carrier protein ThiS [Pseudoalteromonas]|uniref:Thiamine biosynthesis protein ThiS n=2 Tax=Pseudoalteromonas TaxID=53246 RepID=A0A4Q7EJD4_9GAMM|nr:MULTISPECIES: sulfur carrier protein ThiS [Pseudoalteromonas]MCF2910295.1 sulfur carrier protein ThiS [Pseudoalteromonas sp. DL2-H2.2]MCG7536743.1 sulfur carrier protein ThiS [Pseudoalteromonas sp. OOF1S-7]QTL36734.1 sulfur carrier protein ThiS [Pseudoalteromonas viridis]RZM83575.1 thiamine biosynthesis protein ThiS [Pseudoalteromonas rubra]